MSQIFKLPNGEEIELELPLYRKFVTGTSRGFIKIKENLTEIAIGLDFGDQNRCHIDRHKHGEYHTCPPGFYKGSGDYAISDETEWMGAIVEVLEILEQSK